MKQKGVRESLPGAFQRDRRQRLSGTCPFLPPSRAFRTSDSAEEGVMPRDVAATLPSLVKEIPVETSVQCHWASGPTWNPIL